MKVKHISKADCPFKIKFDNKRKSRQQWRADRAQYIGASDVCAVLGVSKYRGPYEVAAVKLGQIEEFNGNATTRLGTLMERPILEYWLKENASHAENPVDVVSVFTCPFVLEHKDHAVLSCNLDAFGVDSQGEQFVIEIKHAGGYARPYLKDWQAGEQPRGIALEYFTQVQAQIAVTGCSRGVLVAMCDKDLFVIDVKADAESVALIVSEIPAFWDRYIATGELPPPSHADGPAIAAMYPPKDPDAEQKTAHRPDMRDAVTSSREQVDRLNAEIGERKRKIEQIKNTIKAEMGSAETMLLGPAHEVRPVKWRTVNPKGNTGRQPYRRFAL